MARPRKLIQLEEIEDKEVLFAPENASQVEIEATKKAEHMKEGRSYILSGRHANILISRGFAVLKKVIAQ